MKFIIFITIWLATIETDEKQKMSNQQPLKILRRSQNFLRFIYTSDFASISNILSDTIIFLL